MTGPYIGRARSRVDGPKKVTGAAKYAAEYNVVGLVYGIAVPSAVARGRIKRIDTSRADALPGVLKVYTHDNRPRVASDDKKYQDQVSVPGGPFRPLYDAEIQYSGQPVACVVAESIELARHAASLVQVEYEKAAHDTDFESQVGRAYVPEEKRETMPPALDRGDAKGAFESAPVKHSATYGHSYEHHNPMEMHASTVVWDGENRLTVYDKTQGAPNSQKYITQVFGLKKEDVRVIAAFVGGAFGSGLRPHYHVFLAVMAALDLKRPVRVMLTRQQMFTIGYRPASIHRMALGAKPDGSMLSFTHEAIANTSRHEDFMENYVSWSSALYDCQDVHRDHRLVDLDHYTPADMRAPGGATGMYAIECAVDELAVAAGVDPLELRLRNYSERDWNVDKPFSSKALRECFRLGAERFGWSRRDPKPGSMRDGDHLIGWGMATGIWEAMREEASAKATLTPDGKLDVASATTDIGTGTYTIMTQIAAETLGLPIEDVSFRLGDSTMPEAPVEGGSMTASTVGPAVQMACAKVGDGIFKLAQDAKDSPLANAKREDVEFVGGMIRLRADASKALSIRTLVKDAGEPIEGEADSKPDDESEKYAKYTHSAVFAEVRVDADFGMVRVTRVVNAVAAGRIVNPTTAASQVVGGVVWGIGMALHEETFADHKLGRFMNHNFAEYHVPVNADVERIEVIFAEEQDKIINPLGIKGLGEIGIVGTAAAIANAVYHATGKRVRRLPITLDKVLGDDRQPQNV